MAIIFYNGQAKAKKQIADARTDTEAILREKGLSEELIAEIRAEIEAKRQARESRS